MYIIKCNKMNAAYLKWGVLYLRTPEQVSSMVVSLLSIQALSFVTWICLWTQGPLAGFFWLTCLTNPMFSGQVILSRDLEPRPQVEWLCWLICSISSSFSFFDSLLVEVICLTLSLWSGFVIAPLPAPIPQWCTPKIWRKMFLLRKITISQINLL